jgi:DNA-binding CsgD family transcriptional regulator
MARLQRRAKHRAVGRRGFAVITGDLVLGLGIGAILGRMKDFTFAGHAVSFDDGTTRAVSRGAAGLIVDVRLWPAPQGGLPLDGVAGNGAGAFPIVAFLPPGWGQEAIWACERSSVVTTCDPPEEWHAALWAAARGGRHLSPPATRLLAEALPAAAPASHGDGKLLSPREQEVLALTRAGCMPREIARALGRSVKTIEAHYARIKIKLGVEHMDMLRKS